MVAQISTDTFTSTSQTPRPDPSDSDDLVLALETARALEAQGDVREAARWLRRAAEQAESEGRDDRVLELARAAADLTHSSAPPSSPSARPSLPASNAGARGPVRPPAPKPGPRASTSPPEPPLAPPAPSRPPPRSALAGARVSAPPVAAKLPAPRPMGIGSSSAAERPALAPRTSSPARLPTPPPALSAITGRNGRAASETPVGEQRDTEHTKQIATIRVAIPASGCDANVFVVRRLAEGQPVPAGTTEAMIVLTGSGGSRSS